MKYTSYLILTSLLLFTVVFNNFSQTSDLIISEYSEGSSNNKYVEIFNGTGASVDLSNYQIWRISNGGSWPEATASMSGTLNDGDVYVVYNGLSDQTIVASGDLSSGVVAWNGDDAVGLAKDISGTMTLIDAIGEDGSDPGSGWSVAGTSNGTANKTLVRKPDICSPNTNWTTSSGTNTTNSEWTVYAQNTWSYIGSHLSNCSSSSATTPSAPTISNIDNGEGQVTVNFTAGSDGGAAITDYEYSINNGASFTSMGTTNSPYTISGLTNGTDYNIQIRAVNSEGAGTASNTAVGSPFTNELTLGAFNSATTENFNSLASSGTSITLPTGFYLDESGSSANSTYSTSTGSSTAGNTYSFGSDNDRALGGVASGNLQTSFGAKIRNETGTTLNSVVISYTGESWRIGSANRIDQLDFQYSTDATGLDDGTWTDFDNLNYVNMGQAIGSGSIQYTSSLNDTLTNLGVSNNSTFWIRWNDLDATGADDGMAVDDLSITAICKAGTVAVSDDYILAGNNITWTYTGSDFDSYEYQWNSNGWNAPWTTNNPQTWGAGWTGNIGQTLYVRAKAVCGSESDLSTVVSTYWNNCYTEPITATVDGVSISDGGDFTINSTVEWTWEHAGSGVNNGAPNEGGGSGHALGYYWGSDPANSDDYAYVWNTNPQQWNDFNGGFFTTTDRKLYVKARSTGDNSCTNYSNSYYITLKKPEITVSTSSINLTTCSGYNGNSESFDVSGSYIKNSDGITINAPTDFEISQDNNSFSSSINLSPTDGTISTTTIYTRMTSSASGTPSGNITCTSTSADAESISLSGTMTSAPVITSGDFTGASTCGVSEYNVSIANSLSGSWTENISGLTVFDPTQGNQTFTPFPAGFNNDIIMTWTENQGACSGKTDAVSIRFNQPIVSGSMDTDSWTWGGNSSNNWTTGSNWHKWDGSKWVVQSSSYPDAGSKIYILPTTDVCVSNSLINTASSIGDLNIQGGTFDLGSSNTSITGNISNNGTLQGGSGTVTLSGAADQTISGDNSLNFYNLTINKFSGNVVVSTQTDIRNTLTMTKGNIVNSQPVVIGVNSENPGTLSHVSGIITGELRRFFANATGSSFFPVGTSSNLRDVTINFTQAPGTDEYLTVSYVAGVPTLGGSEGSYSGLPLVTGDNQLIQNYSDDGYWNIDPTSGLYESTEINSAAYEITLRCKALTVQPTDVSKVRIIKSAGSENSSLDHATWTGLDLLSFTGSAADFTITASATGFSKFGAGSDDGNALPVELISFNGSCNNGGVDLTWQTASEYNSSYFDLEKSRDGNNWNVLYSTPAAWHSTELIEYEYSDENLQGENNYYRLKQVDIDGTAKTYEIINVNCENNNSIYFDIYPNPSYGNIHIVLNDKRIKGEAFIRITDTKGHLIFNKPIDVNDGINMYILSEVLSSGIYYINIVNRSQSTSIMKHIVL